MQIIVPLGGVGSRFTDQSRLNPEYQKPKPLIQAHGKPLVLWALESLPCLNLPGCPALSQPSFGAEKLIFICRKEHQDQFSIADSLIKVLGNNIQVVFQITPAQGAADTTLLAKKLIDPSGEILILDCDVHFDGQSLLDQIKVKNVDTVGVIPVIKPPDQEVKWSYTLFDPKTMQVTTVGEKDPELVKQGAFANIGCYYFSQGHFFIDQAEEMIKSNERYGPMGKKEFYIAPIYNRLIQRGMRVEAAPIKFFWNLGTPQDLELFLRDYHQ